MEEILPRDNGRAPPSGTLSAQDKQTPHGCFTLLHIHPWQWPRQAPTNHPLPPASANSSPAARAKPPLEQGKALCWGGASAQGHDTFPGLFLLSALTSPGPSSQGNYWGKDPKSDMLRRCCDKTPGTRGRDIIMVTSLPHDFSNIHLTILVSSGCCWLPRDHGVQSSSLQTAPALLG